MTTGKLNLRPGVAADAEAIADLHARSWRDAYRGILQDAYLDGPIHDERRRVWSEKLAALSPGEHITLVLEVAGAVLGLLCILPRHDPRFGAFIDNLHVDPSLKGRGLGRRLLAAGMAELASRGEAGPLYLYVFEVNAAARRFYERIGGQALDSAPHPEPDGTSPMAVRYVWASARAMRLGG